MTVREEPVKSEHVTLRLEKDLIEQLRLVAKRNDRSLSAEARMAVRQYLERERNGDAA